MSSWGPATAEVRRLYAGLRLGIWLSLASTLAYGWWFLAVPAPYSYLIGLLSLLAIWGLYVEWRQKVGWYWLLQGDLLGLMAFFAGYGGGSHPLVALLLVPITVAAINLGWRGWLWLVLQALTGYGLLMHWHVPVPAWAPHHGHGQSVHLWGMWFSFGLAAVLIGLFLLRLVAQNRWQQQRLELAHQQQLRQANLMATGALAAATSHYLATPINNLMLLCESWQQEADWPLALRADLDLMQQQLSQCQWALQPLRREAQGEMQAFRPGLNRLLERWHLLHPASSYRLDPLPEPLQGYPWPSEPLLAHAIWNLLDNAAAVSPQVALRFCLAEHSLTIEIQDQGPGFPGPILAGVWGQSGKAQGLGLGLLLVQAAMEGLGGTLTLRNLPQGGMAQLRLPLSWLEGYRQ